MNYLKTLIIACCAAAAPFALAQSDPARAPVTVEGDVVIKAPPGANHPAGGPSVDVIDALQSTRGAAVDVLDGDPHDPTWQKRHFDAVRIYYNNEAKKENAAYLGISASPVTPALREQLKLTKGMGLVVDFIEPKSPAEEAGIKQYDVLQKLGDQLLINAHQFAVLVRAGKTGDEVTLTIIRQGESRQIKAKLAQKQVTALDEKNPWGSPPGPWEKAEGADVTFGYAEGPLRTELRTMQEVPVLSRVPLVGRMFQTPYPLVDVVGEIRWTDDQNDLSLNVGRGSRKLVIKDKSGKTLFEGPIDTEEQRRSIPADVRDKAQSLEQALPSTRLPSTQPSSDAVPGFGRPGLIRLRKLPTDKAEVPTRIDVKEERLDQ